MTNICSATFLFFLFTVCFGQRDKRNNLDSEIVPTFGVCVVGGGAAGMTTAVLALDKAIAANPNGNHDFDVLVVEKYTDVGGHCDTFIVDGALPGEQNWIEYGVQQIPNTALANVVFNKTATTGGWAIDTLAFFNRFATTIPLAQSAIGAPKNVFVSSLETPFFPPVVPAPPPPIPGVDFQAAVERLLAIYSQYPWLDNGQIDVPIPSALLVPFSTFINTHNLSILSDTIFNGLLYFGGMGDWNILETYYALRNLAPTIAFLDSFAPANSTPTFVINGGCASFYNGMKLFITNGAARDNVWTDTTLYKVERPSEGNETGPDNYSILKGTRGGMNAKAKCSKVVFAFSQTPGNIDFIDLDQSEIAFFSQVSNRVYAGGVVSVTGGVAAAVANNFTFVHLDFTRPFEFNHANSGWLAMQTTKSYAPASFYSFSNNQTTTKDQLRAQVAGQFDQIVVSGGLFTGYTIHNFHLHEYYPRPSNANLSDASGGGFYERLQTRQGKRNTFWVGTLQAGMAAHHSIMDKVKRLVDSTKF